MKSYLIMIAVRMLEMKRVLKETGSIYLHCDPTASHYLKMVMDSVFGKNNFRNDISWKRINVPKSTKNKFGAVHDSILLYSKSHNITFNQVYSEYDPEYVKQHYRQWIGIDISPRAIQLVRTRLEYEVGFFGEVISCDDIPKCSEKLPNYRTHKHTLYGEQEGLCGGCSEHFPFRNFTVDHIVPQSKGGTDHYDNLQLLCNYCNSVKGTGTQEELISRLKEQGVLK